MQKISWRTKFIELCEGVFRELGFPPPAMLHEDSLPLAMELEIEGLAVELLHTPNSLAHLVLVVFRLGEAPTGGDAKGMQAMLTANLNLMRTHEAAFGISADSGEIRCVYYEDLASSQPADVLEKIRRIAPDAQAWKNRFFESPTDRLVDTGDLQSFSLA